MFAEIKRLSTHISVYGITNILSRSLSFILLPIHTRILESTAEYGVAIIIFAFIGFVNVLYLHGIDTAFLRFYLLRETGVTKKNVFSTALFSICAASIVLSTCIYLYSDQISRLCFETSEYGHILKYTSGILFFDSLAILPFLTLRAEERSLKFMVLKLINILLTIGLNIYFVVQRGVEGIFIANLLASIATFALVSPIIITRITLAVSKKVYKELLKFGLPYIIPGVSIISMDLIDRFFIERMLGESAAGIYGAGYKMAMSMAVAVAAFRFAWHPFFLSITENEGAKDIFARVLTYFVMIAGWLYIFIVFFIQDIIAIEVPIIGGNLIRREYWDGMSIVPVVMAAYIFYGIYVNFVVGIYVKKKSLYLAAITGISASINIVLNYYLIPRYNMMGAAAATVTAYACMALLLLLVSRKLFSIQYEYGRLLHLVIIIGAFFVLYVNFFNEYNLLLKLIILGAYPFILMISGFFKPDEKAAMRNKLHKIVS